MLIQPLATVCQLLKEIRTWYLRVVLCSSVVFKNESGALTSLAFKWKYWRLQGWRQGRRLWLPYCG